MVETSEPTKREDAEDASDKEETGDRPFDGPPPEAAIPAVKKYLATGGYPPVVTKNEKRAIRRRAKDCVLEGYKLYYYPKAKGGEVKERLLLSDRNEAYQVMSAEERLKRAEVQSLEQPKLVKDNEVFHCEVCYTAVSGAMNYTAHLQGKKHLKKLNPKGPTTITSKNINTAWPKSSQEWIKLYKSQHVSSQPSDPPQGSLSGAFAPHLVNRKENEMFVGGLTFTTEEKAVRKYFEQWGKVTEVRVITDKETGKSRGFAFVSYSQKEEMLKCLDSGPHVLDGRPIQPRAAEEGRNTSQQNEEDISGGDERKSKFMRLMGKNKKIPTVTGPFGFVYGSTESDFQQIPQEYGVAQSPELTNQDFSLATPVQQTTQGFGTQQIQPSSQEFGNFSYPSAPVVDGSQLQQSTQGCVTSQFQTPTSQFQTSTSQFQTSTSQFQTSTSQFQQPNQGFGNGQVQPSAYQYGATHFQAWNQGFGVSQYQASNQGFDAAQYQMANQFQAPNPGLAVQTASQAFGSQPSNQGFGAQTGNPLYRDRSPIRTPNF